MCFYQAIFKNKSEQLELKESCPGCQDLNLAVYKFPIKAVMMACHHNFVNRCSTHDCRMQGRSCVSLSVEGGNNGSLNPHPSRLVSEMRQKYSKLQAVYANREDQAS